METQDALRQIARVRMHFQMNNRLRLESLAALSRTFREHGEAISDELLALIVPAVSEELPGESSSAALHVMAKKPSRPPTGRPPMGKPPLGRPPLGRPPKGRPGKKKR